jgi:hypothetical protein
MYIDFSGNSSISISTPTADFASSSRTRAAIYWPSPPRVPARAYELLLALESMDQLAMLPEDWDGHGGAAIAPRIIERAKVLIRVISTLAPMPELVPNPNGTISMEWSNDKGRAHLEIGEEQFSFSLKGTGRTTVYHMGALDHLDLAALCASIAGAIYQGNMASTSTWTHAGSTSANF